MGAWRSFQRDAEREAGGRNRIGYSKFEFGRVDCKEGCDYEGSTLAGGGTAPMACAGKGGTRVGRGGNSARAAGQREDWGTRDRTRNRRARCLGWSGIL